MIRLDKVDKYFNKGQANAIHVLNQISLELPDKGMVAVFGRSGCGKTTLLNVCGGLDDFSGGSLTINGCDIRKDTDTLRNREIGYIFQNYNLNPKESVQENVADALRLVGMKDEEKIRERVRTALSAVGMQKFSLRRPDTLSGGQQQRVAIARAIVKDPPVILADEPTGNLDEANTIQVMDMLRSIANEHLVVLVTHEAKLVDLYCDVVVKLSDGRVESVYTNEKTAGAGASGRNEIWLGELPKSETVWRNADVEYYGSAPEEPLHLVVVNKDGRLFLKVKSPNVQILDESSEVKLREGVREARPEAEKRQLMDLSALPPVEAGKCGRLFHLKNSVRSGLEAVSRKGKKKGGRLLRLVMMLFAAILVLTAASSGTGIRKISEAGGKVGRRLYFLEVGGSADLEKIEAAASKENGFDSIYYQLSYGDPYMLPTFRVTPGHFVTSAAMDSALTVEACPLSSELLPSGASSLAGSKGEDGIVLTRAAADALLETSSVGYLQSYRDLIGLSLGSGDDGTAQMQPKITAVIEGSEKIIYLPEEALADWLLSSGGLQVIRSSRVEGYERAAAKGHTIAVNYYEGTQKVKAGDTVWARGVELIVDSVVDASRDADTSPFYRHYREGGIYSYDEPLVWGDVGFLVSDADYVRIAQSLGKTDDIMSYDQVYDLDHQKESSRSWYAAVHAADPDKAEAAAAALAENAGIVVITPSDASEMVTHEARAGARGNLITLAVMTAILCLCMYFIMRANLLNRVREVGICRAIGVTKGNLVFRFLIEALVLCGTTVFVGFALSSFVMRLWVVNSSLMRLLFYYPLWMMLLLLALLVFLCVFCGILPVLLLLRKTPSQILAKYDI